jgi:hypothetical protein
MSSRGCQSRRLRAGVTLESSRDGHLSWVRPLRSTVFGCRRRGVVQAPDRLRRDAWLIDDPGSLRGSSEAMTLRGQAPVVQHRYVDATRFGQ